MGKASRKKQQRRADAASGRVTGGRAQPRGSSPVEVEPGGGAQLGLGGSVGQSPLGLLEAAAASGRAIPQPGGQGGRRPDRSGTGRGGADDGAGAESAEVLLGRLRVVEEKRRRLAEVQDAKVRFAIRRAVAAGASWRQVGEALGVTAGAAHQRHGPGTRTDAQTVRARSASGGAA